MTNRAGNFYVEGDESELVLPYTASLRWSLDGRDIQTNMFTTPEYGGCARCHGVESESPGVFPPGWPASEYAVPTTDIFTPGLRPSER